MANTALVTGASAGIGRAFAALHAARGGDLIITARRGDALETLRTELEAKHGVTVTCIALDLGAPDGARDLIAAVEAGGHRVDVLINNAGFGGHGLFVSRDIAKDLAMIDLNVKALVELTHHFAKAMAARGGGRILNVSSTASYMPGPLQATYFATKAFVSSFSQALAEELTGTGVTVTALEPGYVTTEFAAVADLEGTPLTRRGATPEAVAKVGYDAMMAGKLRVINDKLLGFQLRWVIPFLPRRATLRLVRKLQEKAS